MDTNKDERLAVLEVKVDQQGRDISEVKGDVKSLLAKFDIVLGLRNEIDNLKKDLLVMKATNFRNKVVYPIFAAILSSVLTALILSAIFNK